MTVHIEPDGTEQINEINNFQDMCWVSPPEAMWRIFLFSLSEIHPSVRMLAINLPNQQQIRYNEKENLAEVADKETSHRSMLLAFFVKK
jgi:ATP-dependent DNA helicase PIF1